MVNQVVGEAVTAIRSGVAETAAHSSSAPLRVHYLKTRAIEMEYIVDIQGFKRSSNLFVVKKLVMLELSENSIPSVYHFQPACQWKKLLDEEKRVNEWLVKKYHGMAWESGMFPYRWLIGILQGRLKNTMIIQVKGLEKKRWIEEMVPGK